MGRDGVTTDPAALDDGSPYTPAYHARVYLEGLAAAFAEGARPVLDAQVLGAAEFPTEFARLAAQWEQCLDAARTVNRRYYADWNASGGGVLTVIAPATRDAALAELRGVWKVLCRNYVETTLDRDRLPFDCRFCGVHVSPEDVWDGDRCPHCFCALWLNGDETDWV